LNSENLRLCLIFHEIVLPPFGISFHLRIANSPIKYTPFHYSSLFFSLHSNVQIEQCKVKGACLVADKEFLKGELICSYQGERLVGAAAIKERRPKYDQLCEDAIEKGGDNSNDSIQVQPGSYIFEYSLNSVPYA